MEEEEEDLETGETVVVGVMMTLMQVDPMQEIGEVVLPHHQEIQIGTEVEVDLIGMKTLETGGSVEASEIEMIEEADAATALAGTVMTAMETEDGHQKHQGKDRS